MTDLFDRIVYSMCTLYMMMVLFRWLAPRLEVEVHAPQLAWLPRVVDPVVTRVRRVLPHMGPMDFGPLATVFLVWFVRTIVMAAF